MTLYTPLWWFRHITLFSFHYFRSTNISGTHNASFCENDVPCCSLIIVPLFVHVGFLLNTNIGKYERAALRHTTALLHFSSISNKNRADRFKGFGGFSSVLFCANKCKADVNKNIHMVWSGHIGSNLHNVAMMHIQIIY